MSWLAANESRNHGVRQELRGYKEHLAREVQQVQSAKKGILVPKDHQGLPVHKVRPA
jgi:hypothetical protein